MAITRAEVLKIAALAKLRFSEPELETFIPQFQNILDYIDTLKEVDIEGVNPTSHLASTGDPAGQVSREDELRPSLAVDEALGNAPDRVDDHFGVPKVI